VLGMMRTGTSVVARILELVGIHLGSSDQLLETNRANPTGFWEHRAVIGLNDEILARFGGTWYEPPELPPGWEEDKRLADLRSRFVESILPELSARSPWGWKDPRTSLTPPFWLGLVPSLGCIVCLRHPVEAARSLEALPWAQRRMSDPFEQGLALWLRYTRSALEHSGSRRLLVFYEDVLADSRAEATRVASFVGRDDAIGSPVVRREIRSFVRPELRHQERRIGPPSAQTAEQLYVELRRAAGAAAG
jgi:hypothetical protein